MRTNLAKTLDGLQTQGGCFVYVCVYVDVYVTELRA